MNASDDGKEEEDRQTLEDSLSSTTSDSDRYSDLSDTTESDLDEEHPKEIKVGPREKDEEHVEAKRPKYQAEEESSGYSDSD